MHDLPRQTLKEIVEAYGVAVLKDPRRCRALMMDFCGEYRGEINLVEMALREGVAEELQSASSRMPRGLVTARLAQRLKDAYFLPGDAAIWAVETCAAVLEPSVSASPINQERVLSSNVPATIYVRPWLADEEGWETVGETPGDVAIPAEGEVRISARIGDAMAAALAADLINAGPVHQLDLSYSPISDEGLSPLLGLPELAVLNLSRTRISDASLERLGDLQIRELSLWGVEGISDQGVAALELCHHLTSLDLGRSPGVGDPGLRALRELPALAYVGLSGTRVTDRGLRWVGALPALRSLDVSATGITGRGLDELAQSGSVVSLDLSGCVGLRPEGLVSLRALAGLEELQLGRCGLLTDQALMHLRSLAGLRVLNLEGLDITDAGLLYLSRLVALTSLDLSWTPITDQGVARLVGLRGLQSLSLAGTQVTDRAAPDLARLRGLVYLDLSNTSITDATLRDLRPLTALATLDLEGTRVHDAGLVHLGTFTSLGHLFLGATSVSDVGLELLSRISNLGEIDLTLCPGVSDAGVELLRRVGVVVTR